MANAAKVTIDVVDQSFSVSEILLGIAYVEGITVRGPVGDPSEIITSWAHFQRVFGGYKTDSDDPLLLKRALDRGSLLRVNRVAHYSDITDASSVTAVKSAISPVKYITFSAALVASNVYNVSINGSAISPVTFASNSDATMAAIATAIALITTYVQDAFVKTVSSTTSDDRVIVIVPKSGVNLTISGSVVTLGASQATTATTTGTGVIDSKGNVIFTPAMKYAGEDYDNIVMDIKDASNGSADYFDILIQHLTDDSVPDELYQNLTIPGTPTAAESAYLKPITEGSQIIDITYGDLSSLTATVRPKNERYYFSGGDDGLASLADGDYIGDSGSKTGFYAFDSYDDGMIIGVPGTSSGDIHGAGAAYAANRQDLVYFGHLDNDLTSAADIYGERDGLDVDTSFAAFYAGGLIVKDPITGAQKNISELGDIIGISSLSDQKKGPWWAFDGPNRGIIFNAMGVVNNFGGNGNYSNLNLLANHQVNMVIVKNKTIVLWGNFTAQLANSKLSFVNIRKLIIYIVKSLTPTLETFIAEQNDIITWKAIFRAVEPFLTSLKNSEKRALYDYRWDGDQDKESIDQITVNNPTDVDNGIYKVNLYIKPINSINEIKVSLIITPTSVSFEDNLNQTA